MVRIVRRCGVAIAALVLMGGSAEAATITRTYSFVFSDFELLFGSDPTPVDPVIGSFTVTFDTDLTANNVTSGLVVHGLNVPVDGFFAYSWNPAQDLLRFGGITQPSDTVLSFIDGTNDFGLSFFDPISGPPTGPSAAYSQANLASMWLSSMAVVEATTAVPEPSTWALTILGFAAGGLALRGARRRAV